MSRALTPPVLALACLLVGCGRPPATEAEQAASPSPPPVAATAPDSGAPALWSIETLGQDGAVASTVRVCTDGAIRAAFARSLPAPDGKPCALIDKPVIGPGRFSARCRADGADFTVHSDAKGDMATDFNVETTISSETGERREYAQTSRFRNVGACPADWTIGDSAAPGASTVTNALTGASRTVSTAAP